MWAGSIEVFWEENQPVWAQGKQGGSFQFGQRKLERTSRDETEEGMRSTSYRALEDFRLYPKKERG